MTAIDDKFQELLQAGLDLGPPSAAEEDTYDGGALRRFQFGVIYFHPRVGAFECHGAILGEYESRLEVLGELGYPTSDEMDDPDVQNGRLNTFEQGRITWNPIDGIAADVTDPGPFLPQVIVKVLDEFPLDIGRGNELSIEDFAAFAGPAGAGVAVSLRAILPEISLHRLFDSVSADQIRALVAQAQEEDPSYEPARFENFLEIDCPDGFDPAPLVDALEQFTAVVEYAYAAAEPSDPIVTPSNDPLFAQQGYLSAGPAGIGVQAAHGVGYLVDVVSTADAFGGVAGQASGGLPRRVELRDRLIQVGADAADQPGRAHQLDQHLP